MKKDHNTFIYKLPKGVKEEHNRMAGASAAVEFPPLLESAMMKSYSQVRAE